MTIRIAVLLLSGCLAATPQCGLGQEADDFPDSSLTREQWQQRIDEARRSSEEFVASTRTQSVPPPQPEQRDAEAADHAMNDPSLREGDIVATGKGFVVFVGRDEMHQPQDFQAQGFKGPEHKARDFEPQDFKPQGQGTPSQRPPRR